MKYIVLSIALLFLFPSNDLLAQSFNHADEEFKMLRKYNKIIKMSSKYIAFHYDMLDEIEAKEEMTKDDLLKLEATYFKWPEVSTGQWMQVAIAEHDIKKYGEDWLGKESFEKLELIRAEVNNNIDAINLITGDWWKNGVKKDAAVKSRDDLMKIFGAIAELSNQFKVEFNSIVETDVPLAVSHHNLLNALTDLLDEKGEQSENINKVKEAMLAFDFAPYEEFWIVKGHSESAFEKINLIIAAIESGEYSRNDLVTQYVNSDDAWVNQEEDGIVDLVNWALEVWKNNNPDVKYMPLSHMNMK